MSFRKIYDALTKGPMLEESFGRVEEMHDATKEMFELSFKCLFETKKVRTCDNDLGAMDKKVNQMEKEIRKEVFEYLAITSSPNVSASMLLVSTVIDYERIGDLSKNISQLGGLFHTDLDDEWYRAQIDLIEDKMLTIFDLTKEAVKDGDPEKGKKVVRLHDEIKDIHNEIVKKLNEDPNLTPQKGMTYALLTYYLRRINGHLSNVSSTAIKLI